MARKQKRWLFPTGAERDYVALLRRYAVRPLEQATREILFPALDRIDAQYDLFRRQDVDPRELQPSTGWFEELRMALLETLAFASVSDATARAIVDQIGTNVATFNRQQFMAVLRSVYGVDIITADPNLRALLSVWEAENVALIKSIPVQAVSRMQGEIVESVRTGRTMEALKKQLRAEFGIADRRAELIARDQVGKLNGQITEERQKSVGIDSYTWRGILDARERPEHVAREGKVFAWNNPPSDGHPGQPIQCRCAADPVLPSWEEMESRITGTLVPAGIYQ